MAAKRSIRVMQSKPVKLTRSVGPTCAESRGFDATYAYVLMPPAGAWGNPSRTKPRPPIVLHLNIQCACGEILS
jgi:hypothetical protein